MPTTHNETLWIDLRLIDIPEDARQHDPEKLGELTSDMAAQGQLQEIVVVPVSSEQSAGSRNDVPANGSPLTADRFEVLAGVGRTLAARKLGWEKIRASVWVGVS